MEISPEQVPAGWTNDPAYLKGLFYRGSEESIFARWHGLDVFQLILASAPDTGDLGYILHSGQNYYWGDLMIDHIFKITRPKTLPEILRVLDTLGEKGLGMEELKRVRDYDEVEREEMGEEDESWKDEPVQEDLFQPVG